MRKNIKLIIYTAIAIGCSSCSGWLDVSPKTDIKASDMLNSENGFQSALAGLYVRMTLPESYGGNFTFNFMERLAQRYDNYSVNNPISDEERAGLYEYKTNATSTNALNQIWSSSYRTIANANNVINAKNIETVIRDANTRNMIKGEALGLRAFLHFDLLRAWGGYYNSADSLSHTIPYRSVFNAEKSPLLRANKVVELIINDLKEAESLLQNDVVDVTNNRQFRMNIHAVRALLARVYLYRGEANYAMAAKYAKRVIDESRLGLVSSNEEDHSMFGETLFALSYYDMVDKINPYFINQSNLTTQLYISNTNLRTVFETATAGVNDIRGRAGFGFYYYEPQGTRMLAKFLSRSTVFNDRLPLIRLSEMYYILCEASGLADAPAFINTVRNARGIAKSQNYGSFTESSRIEALNKEYQKDYFGEGQYFFFLKRQKMNTFYRCPVREMTPVHYRFTLPDNEVEFGWTTDLPD